MKFYKQKKEWTCGATAMRQALAALGINKTEKTLVKLLKTNRVSGTQNRSFPRLAEKLKLNHAVFRNARFSDLKLFFKKKYKIIVCYHSYFPKEQRQGHFATVKKITANRIYLLDPWFGPEHNFSLKYFKKIWRSGLDLDNQKRWFFAIKSNKK